MSTGAKRTWGWVIVIWGTGSTLAAATKLLVAGAWVIVPGILPLVAIYFGTRLILRNPKLAPAPSDTIPAASQVRYFWSLLSKLAEGRMSLPAVRWC
jgi:hypothetical protein